MTETFKHKAGKILTTRTFKHKAGKKNVWVIEISADRKAPERGIK